MAKGVSIQVEGLNKLIQKFGSIPEDVRVETDAEFSAVAAEFVDRAVNDAPTDEGILKAEISMKKVGDMDYEVVSAANYSAYVEFGTRSRVQVPAELQEYASQFKGNGGSSGDAKKSFFGWLKRKGIEPKLWWSIFISVMTKGIHAHPFFFKQMPQAKADINRNLKGVVERALNK